MPARFTLTAPPAVTELAEHRDLTGPGGRLLVRRVPETYRLQQLVDAEVQPRALSGTPPRWAT